MSSQIKQYGLLLGIFLLTTQLSSWDAWGAMLSNHDSLAMIYRLLDPSFADGDFYTDVSTQPNARLPFGLLFYALATISSLDPDLLLHLFRGVLWVILPGLWLYVLYSCLAPLLAHARYRSHLPGLLAVGIALLAYTPWYHLFRLATWGPLYWNSNAQSLAELIGLIAAVLLIRGQSYWLPAVLLAVATILHPVFMPFFGLFLLLFLPTPSRLLWRALLGIVLPMPLLWWLYLPSTTLSADIWTVIFTQLANSGHFFPSNYATWTPALSWQANFVLYLVWLLLPAGILYLGLGMRQLAYKLCLFALSILLALAINYLYISYPLPLLGTLSPSRLYGFVYWVGLMGWVAMLAVGIARLSGSSITALSVLVLVVLLCMVPWQLPPKGASKVAVALAFFAASIWLYSPAAGRWRWLTGLLLLGSAGIAWLYPALYWLVLVAAVCPFAYQKLARSWQPYTVAILPVAALLYIHCHDWLATHKTLNKELHSWIAQHTGNDAVFYTSDMNMATEYIWRYGYRRPLYASSSFPFREDYFLEWAHRHLLSSYSAEHPPTLTNLQMLARGEGTTPLSPPMVEAMKKHYRLDYVAIRHEQIQDTSQWLKYPLVHKDPTWRVYKVR